jgi:hypothetical protein
MHKTTSVLTERRPFHQCHLMVPPPQLQLTPFPKGSRTPGFTRTREIAPKKTAQIGVSSFAAVD